ncbi:hypothetical protein [Sutcliffiella halmapala]|uniref:hypothetical protein n=1 Tax=Sutcliffiella halmapala TaxID=79882 RepID=UPI0014751BD4|nr:hypothetical protein [Sutcliffiella halmapala]
MIELVFSGNKFDQQRLAKSGGQILIKPNGLPVFQFKSKDQFNKYFELGKKGATA